MPRLKNKTVASDCIEAEGTQCFYDTARVRASAVGIITHNENLWSNLTDQEARGIFLVTKWTLKIVRIE